MGGSTFQNSKITVVEAFCSSWKSSVGVGIYSMPYAFYQGSPLFGCLIFVTTVIVSVFTTSLMAELHDYLLNFSSIKIDDAYDNDDNSDENDAVTYQNKGQFDTCNKKNTNVYPIQILLD